MRGSIPPRSHMSELSSAKLKHQGQLYILPLPLLLELVVHIVTNGL
jgi:hypothetical protein